MIHDQSNVNPGSLNHEILTQTPRTRGGRGEKSPSLDENQENYVIEQNAQRHGTEKQIKNNHQ